MVGYTTSPQPDHLRPLEEPAQSTPSFPAVVNSFLRPSPGARPVPKGAVVLVRICKFSVCLC